ncbi:MAG TPA: DUF4136 domain-containing protein [Nitrospira sp.]|nr:DUF4136 domain-containing protein [Nitrospira sp.]
MRRRRRGCLLILAVSLVACTSFKVNTDHDPTVDFSSFKTFAFAGPAELNKGGIYDNSLTRRRVESAVVRELTGKGLRQVGLDEPQDLLVHYWVNIQDKQRIDSTGPTVGVARYPGGYGWGAGYGGGVTTYEYREGTLILDLIEPAKKQLVWRATIVGTLQDATNENVELGNKAIAEAFESYPPSAKSR